MSDAAVNKFIPYQRGRGHSDLGLKHYGNKKKGSSPGTRRDMQQLPLQSR